MNGAQILDRLSQDAVTFAKCCGVYARDKLPLNVPVDQFCVCNTDIWTKNGRHWILIYFPPSGPTEFFDPLGEKPNAEFIQFMGDDYMYSTQRYQSTNSTACAFYCIFFAYMKCRGIPFQSITDLFGSERNVIRFVDMI